MVFVTMAMNDISFGMVETRHELCQMGRFIDEYPGTYNRDRHRSWNHETNLPALTAGKRSGFGFWLKGELKGGVILKPLGVNVVEAKYVRVAAPEFAGRGAGRLMMTQLRWIGQEVLAQHNLISSGANEFTVQLDTRADGGARPFFEHFGFEVVQELPLYDPRVPDVIMQRSYGLAS